MTLRHALLPVFAAATLLSCGGDEKDPGPGKPRSQASATPQASAPASRADTVNAVAERAMVELPGCTPDESQRVAPAWKKADMVAIRSGICEDGVLDGVTVLEFRDAKAAGRQRQEYSLIDNPDAKNGPIVANGKIICHEETIRRKETVNCMLVVNRYILLAHGKPGTPTDDVMDERMPGLARAAE